MTSTSAHEDRRLHTLHRYQLLDTHFEQSYDDLTTLAQAVCNTPIAIISLVDRHRQWFKSIIGLPFRETPRSESFCEHAIMEPDAVFEIQDASLDSRFASSLLVAGSAKVRFYAGAPLVMSNGHAIGTVCVMDNFPRTLSLIQRNALQSLARQVVSQIEIQETVRNLEHESMTDPLTSLWNRRIFDHKLHRLWDTPIQDRTPLSLLIIDLDNFKTINDLHGHIAGDKVLVHTASIIRSQLTENDIAVRFGGDEFCVLLPGADVAKALRVAEELRFSIERANFHSSTVTASLGVATLSAADHFSPNTLIARADRALYEAKSVGRNCVRDFSGWFDNSMLERNKGLSFSSTAG